MIHTHTSMLGCTHDERGPLSSLVWCSPTSHSVPVIFHSAFCLVMYFRRLHFLEYLTLAIWIHSANGGREKPGCFSLSSSFWALPLTAVVSPPRNSSPSWSQLLLVSHCHDPTIVTQPSSSVTGNAIFFQYHSSLMDGSSFLM